ncbi:MAG: DUF814 domain-containing protein [Myxococcaceae bacterium]|nr:DUF814 domain-containing protein [Myxococcaceae bacterium]
MFLKPGELESVARELDDALHGAIVQKVYHPLPEELWLELRQPGRSTMLCISARPGLERLAVGGQRPESPPHASGLQQRLRKLLGGKRLLSVQATASAATLYFPTVRLVANVLQHTLLALPPEALPAEREPAAATHPLPLATALAQRLGTDDAAEKRLERHLKKLARTRAKVAEEAARGPVAEQHRRDGELLSRNLHAVKRGQTTVTLTEYGEAGETSRTLTLDPRRSPKEQVDWHFHQYKRLQRGVAIARERLAKLDRELAAAQAPPESASRVRLPPGPDAGPALPYREYLTARGQRIWVGRGAAHNDTLTFKVAKPHHVWLHARGVTGAHVVVPLDKKQALDQETLLDAAHLAFHHSDARGERSGEVSYTFVRYVRHAGAPGAVTFTREKTFWLKVEPGRLDRLSGSAALPH